MSFQDSVPSSTRPFWRKAIDGYDNLLSFILAVVVIALPVVAVASLSAFKEVPIDIGLLLLVGAIAEIALFVLALWYLYKLVGEIIHRD